MLARLNCIQGARSRERTSDLVHVLGVGSLQVDQRLAHARHLALQRLHCLLMHVCGRPGPVPARLLLCILAPVMYNDASVI